MTSSQEPFFISEILEQRSGKNVHGPRHSFQPADRSSGKDHSPEPAGRSAGSQTGGIAEIIPAFFKA